MRNTHLTYAGLALVTMFIVGGCAESRLAANYGTSYRLQKFGQTLNPQTEKNLEPAYGFDGQAAERTIVKYEKSFEKTAPAPIYNFNISTGGR